MLLSVERRRERGARPQGSRLAANVLNSILTCTPVTRPYSS
jgi:hypothetical protein